MEQYLYTYTEEVVLRTVTYPLATNYLYYDRDDMDSFSPYSQSYKGYRYNIEITKGGPDFTEDEKYWRTWVAESTIEVGRDIATRILEQYIKAPEADYDSEIIVELGTFVGNFGYSDGTRWRFVINYGSQMPQHPAIDNYINAALETFGLDKTNDYMYNPNVRVFETVKK